MNERKYADRLRSDATVETPKRIPNDNIPIYENSIAHPGVFLLAVASGLFGALHAIPWNFEFPSETEKILWQTATIIAAGGPVIGLIGVPFAQVTISAGDPQVFMRKSLRLMREFSWYQLDKGPVDAAYEKLENTLVNTAQPKEPYASIFLSDHGVEGILDLGQELLNFLAESDSLIHRRTELHNDKEFVEMFRRLVDLIHGKEAKKLVDSAKTNVFPQKSLPNKSFNQAVLYTTSILYCLARVSLLGITFSSLRQMPESVSVNTP